MINIKFKKRKDCYQLYTFIPTFIGGGGGWVCGGGGGGANKWEYFTWVIGSVYPIETSETWE